MFCGITIADSRLDDELSVATVEFGDTPKWLQDLNMDPRGFPKNTLLGTLWRAVNTSETDSEGRTAFIRAVMKGEGNANLLYAEMLAEFEDTNVNIQDNQGRTALHWACVENLPGMVALCLSVPECITGLRDSENLTAFDISLQLAGGSEVIPNLFYQSMVEMEETHPQAALLRVLTVTSVPATDQPVFPGVAIFDPIQDRNEPLVAALIDRGIDLTARNEDGDTALHVATRLCNVQIATALLDAGSDPTAVGSGGATPLHWAAQGGQLDIAQLLLEHGADPGAKDESGTTALQLAADNSLEELVVMLQDVSSMEGEADLDPSAEVSDEQIELQLSVEDANTVIRNQGMFDDELAHSCGMLAEGTLFEQQDKELISLLSGMAKNISWSTWDNTIASFKRSPALQQIGDDINRSDKYLIEPYTRRQGGIKMDILKVKFSTLWCSLTFISSANMVMRQFQTWYRRFIADSDVLKCSNTHTGYVVNLLRDRYSPLKSVQCTRILRYPLHKPPQLKVCGPVDTNGIAE